MAHGETLQIDELLTFAIQHEQPKIIILRGMIQSHVSKKQIQETDTGRSLPWPVVGLGSGFPKDHTSLLCLVTKRGSESLGNRTESRGGELKVQRTQI